MQFGVLLRKAGRRQCLGCFSGDGFENKSWNDDFFMLSSEKIALELSVSLPTRNLSRAERSVWMYTPRQTLCRGTLCVWMLQMRLALNSWHKQLWNLLQLQKRDLFFHLKLKLLLMKHGDFVCLKVHPSVLLNWQGIHDFLQCFYLLNI